jgi:hypothetical protein
MEEILKAVANGIFVQQSVNLGSKLLSDRKITEGEKAGFWLSLLFVGLVNLPTGDRES